MSTRLVGTILERVALMVSQEAEELGGESLSVIKEELYEELHRLDALGGLVVSRLSRAMTEGRTSYVGCLLGLLLDGVPHIAPPTALERVLDSFFTRWRRKAPHLLATVVLELLRQLGEVYPPGHKHRPVVEASFLSLLPMYVDEVGMTGLVYLIPGHHGDLADPTKLPRAIVKAIAAIEDRPCAMLLLEGLVGGDLESRLEALPTAELRVRYLELLTTAVLDSGALGSFLVRAFEEAHKPDGLQRRLGPLEPLITAIASLLPLDPRSETMALVCKAEAVLGVHADTGRYLHLLDSDSIDTRRLGYQCLAALADRDGTANLRAVPPHDVALMAKGFHEPDIDLVEATMCIFEHLDGSAAVGPLVDNLDRDDPAASTIKYRLVQRLYDLAQSSPEYVAPYAEALQAKTIRAIRSKSADHNYIGWLNALVAKVRR